MAAAALPFAKIFCLRVLNPLLPGNVAPGPAFAAIFGQMRDVTERAQRHDCRDTTSVRGKRRGPSERLAVRDQF